MSNNPIHRTRATLNPYLFSGGLLLSRLGWDLNYRSWISRSRLRDQHASFSGKRAVILCNGPSLLRTEWSLLDGVYCFGLNKINLLFDDHAFRPSCIVAVNPFVLEQNAAFYNRTGIPLYLDCHAAKVGIGLKENVVMLHSTSIHKFARNCSISVNQGGTVTFVALQLAFHMGFSEVALIGCDHSFTAQGAANQIVRREGPDQDHFHPDYFPDGASWHLPDLDLSEESYRLAMNVFAAHGRRVVNATEGGKLELFPRMSLSEFVREHRRIKSAQEY